MTRHEIATLALKILAMWLFVEAAVRGSDIILILIFSIQGLFARSDGQRPDFLMGAVMGSVPAICELILGILLWRFASRFASRIVSDDPAPVTRPDLTAQSFLSIAFIAIGVWYLFPLLRDIAQLFIMWDGSGLANYWRRGEWQARLWSAIVRLALSLWLILGSRGIARLILHLRRAGIVHEERTEAR